jgi:predicted ATPase/class 3 adenylate cyclase
VSVDSISRASQLPTGAVTFAFTDIEASTQRWERDRIAMQAALVRHEVLLHAAVAQHGGHVFKTVGDAFCAVFSRPEDAVAAMLAAQRAFEAEDFSAVDGLPIRAAIHTGTADERGGDYFGPAVNRVARLLAIAHGGQVIASGVTQDLALGALPAQAAFKDLGAHRLKDLSRPEQVYQLVAPGLRSEFPPLRSLSALPNNLPMELTSFVGRDQEIAEITALLFHHRLVTLAGSGGVGKTRVSLQVAANLLDGSGDGVWFIELAPLADGALIPSTIANAMGMALAPDKEPVTALVDALKSKGLLLVLDNCEHVVEAAAAVIAALLRGAPNVSVLASSRQSLGVSGEETYRMPSFSVPPEDESAGLLAERARDYGAIALFVERAISADKRFALTDDNAPIIADIVRRLDGIALAIELAAPRVKMLDVRQLSKRLDERFRILTGGGRDVLPRQQTLRALIDWSYDLLDDREKTLFARLGIFVDGFTLEAATAVCSDDALDEFDLFDVLSSLGDKSLVAAELTAESTRYRLLESTRLYALEKLDVAGNRRRVADRHLDWVLGAATHAAHLISTRLRFEALEGLEPEMGNLRAAISWARESGRYDSASTIIVSVRPTEFLGFGPRELFDWACAIIDLVAESESATLARLWLVRSEVSFSLRRMTESLDAAMRSLDEAHRSGDADLIAAGLICAANAHTFLFRFDDAKRLLDEASAGIPNFGPFLLYEYHKARGLLAFVQDDPETAARHYTIITEQWRALGASLQRYSPVFANLAEIEYARGNVERAITMVREALVEHKGQNSRVLGNMAAYLIAVDRLAEARAAAEQCLSQVALDSLLGAVVIEHLALVFALVGDTKRAARLVGFTSRAFDQAGSMREYTERVGFERLRAVLIAAHPEDELARLDAEGRAYTWQQARDEAVHRE